MKIEGNDSSNLPHITVVMPVRNEKENISDSLKAVLEQTYPNDRMEVIVVDGMSTDPTWDIVRQFARQYPEIPLHIFENPGTIVPTGMNLAIKRSKGEILIRVDGHTVIDPDYVHKCVATLQRTRADNVGGKMVGCGKNPFARAVAVATSTPFGTGGARFRYSRIEEWVDTVYLGAWPRMVFEKIGLFDEELVRNQDDEFNYRLRAAGGKILLNPNIKSKYTVRSTPLALWKQYFQYGLWKVRVLQKHSQQMMLRQFIPPLFILSLFASAIFALSPSVAYLALFIPLVYLVLNILSSLYTAAKRGWHHLTYLPLIFGILHFSYGIGFVVGMFKFWDRWNDKVGEIPILAT